MDDGSSELQQAPIKEHKKSPFAAIAEKFKKKEDPARPYVKNSWYHGYIHGNSLWPQTSFGIGLTTMDSFLKDPVPDFKQFLDSDLSPNQVAEIGRAMSKMHHGHNVTHATKEHMQKGDEQVRNKRLQELWFHATLTVGNILVNYLDQDTNPTQKIGDRDYFKIDQSEVFIRSNINRINSLLADPVKTAELQNYINVCTQVLGSKEAIAANNDYKELVVQKSKAPRYSEEWGMLGEKSMEIQREVTSSITNSLHQKFSEVKSFNWLTLPMGFQDKLATSQA